jgi:hypothetical protein
MQLDAKLKHVLGVGLLELVVTIRTDQHSAVFERHLSVLNQEEEEEEEEELDQARLPLQISRERSHLQQVVENR